MTQIFLRRATGFGYTFPDGRPDPMKNLLRVGTSSWSSEDWVGPFYPEGTAPKDFLPHYATKYPTVEVDSTFYRLPTSFLCRKWAKDTPEDFRFALKVTRSITHDDPLENAAEFEKFLGAAEELGPKLAFVVFQFGYFNKKSKFPDAAKFLESLAKFSKHCPDRHEYVVEIRNPRWIDKTFLAVLKEHRFGFALTDQEWMPRPGVLWEKFGKDLLTRDFAYVRFLGERERIEKITTKWDKTVIDRTAQLDEWVPILRRFLEQNVPTYAYFNNHYAGHAPASIALFLERMGL